MANGWNPLIGLGFTALGVGYLWEAYQKSSALTPLGSPVFGVTADGLRPNLPYAQLQDSRRLSGLGNAGSEIQIDQKGRKVLHVRDGVRTIQFHEAGSIERRLKFIIDQMKKDSRDPKTITEATAILSGKCPVAKGGLKWCVPAKGAVAEVNQLFYAIVNPNSPYALRYTRDHAHVDMFRSSELMRRIPSGDCFVHGTLVLRDDHKLVPVETLRAGDRIWGLDKWTRVENTWEKGVLPTWLVRLNNGSSMRLTPDHKVWVIECAAHPSGNNCTQESCPVAARSRRVVTVRELRRGMVLLQPERVEPGARDVDPDEAWLEGVFVADGWVDSKTRFAISGKDGHQKEAQKRRVKEICDARGIRTTWHERYIYVYSRELTERFSRLGEHASQKRVSSIDFAPEALEALTEGVMADASTPKSDGTRCLTTTSRELFLQMRVMMKARGKTCSARYIVDHGGLGTNPIWRLQERVGEEKKRGAKLLRVKEIVRDDLALPCFDFATEDKHIWLPEADWTVHNCDDMSIRLGAWLLAAGYSVKCRIVAPRGQPGQWAHIYLLAGVPPGENTRWIPLDPTEPHPPGWEVPNSLISGRRDFEVTP